MIETAWASACTYRQTDHRGGGVAKVIDQLDKLKGASGANISLADMIVLGGNVGVEMAAKTAGNDITVPLTPGRTDATQAMTEVDAHAYLEPRHDAFRNYMQAQSTPIPTEHLMVDRAFMLNLSAPQMIALLGGIRVIGINVGDNNTDGIFTQRPGQLTNDFFVNLIDMGTVWEPVDENEGRFIGRDRKSGENKWTATRVDLVYGSNSQLRAIAEEYAADGGEHHMLHKFISGWAKVMENDRFDLHR